MPFYLYIWTDENQEHLAEHGVTTNEFEEIVSAPDFIELSRSTGRPVAIGHTSAGRRLACIYDLIDESTLYPVTAYEVE